ncbi:MAG: signal transduction histidine kinase, partial [Chitinophagaceae bacterium]|nr:signal transduction histidine kinase [Chitinophagaceae bacterium]
MKKGMLIGCFIVTQFLCCTTFVIAQRSPETISRLIQKSKLDTGRISLFLEAAMSYVLRAGSLQSDMDSAQLFVSNALRLNNSIRSIEWEGKCFFVYSNIFREENNKEKGKQYAEKAIEDLSKSGKKIDLANSYVELARYYDPYNTDDLKEKIKLNEQAAQLFGQAGNKEEQANTIKHLGDLQLVNGDFKKALTELQEALDIFKEIHYSELQGVYDLMSSVSIQSGNYADALKYGLLAMKTAESLNDSSSQLSTIYNHLGATMFYLNNQDQSAQYYQKALSIVFKNKDTGSVFVIVHNLANAFVRANKPSEAIDILKSTEKNYVLPDPLSQVLIYSSLVYAYTEMKQYESANHYVKKLLDISAKRDVTDGLQGDIYNSIIKYYLAIKQYREVVKYCAFNEAYCKKYGVVKNLISNYRNWYRADSALGNFDAALSHYKMLTAINDSSFNETKIKQISELQIQYETEKKDNDIQLLSKQGLLQKKELQQASVLRNVTLAAFALLIIVLILLYYGFRLKQIANHKLELKQREINQKNQELTNMLAEKEWWLKEVHHRVKNNLHTIICLLESQAMYLDKDALQA